MLRFIKNWLIDWVNGVLRPFFGILVVSRRQLTLFMSCLGFTSTRLGLWSFLPKDTPTKNHEDPVLLEPRTPELRVWHFTTEACCEFQFIQERTKKYQSGKWRSITWLSTIFFFSHTVIKAVLFSVVKKLIFKNYFLYFFSRNSAD